VSISSNPYRSFRDTHNEDNDNTNNNTPESDQQQAHVHRTAWQTFVRFSYLFLIRLCPPIELLIALIFSCYQRRHTDATKEQIERWKFRLHAKRRKVVPMVLYFRLPAFTVAVLPLILDFGKFLKDASGLEVYAPLVCHSISTIIFCVWDLLVRCCVG